MSFIKMTHSRATIRLPAIRLRVCCVGYILWDCDMTRNEGGGSAVLCMRQTVLVAMLDVVLPGCHFKSTVTFRRSESLD